MAELTSRIGRPVNFRPPLDVKGKQGSGVSGVVVDEVWADEVLNQSGAHSDPCPNGKHCWGDYSFCAQLIKWHPVSVDGEHSIRLAYYRRRCGENRWEFASQMTVNGPCGTIKELLQRTLAKTRWFECE